MKLAQGDKAVMGVLGDDWGKQQAANILGTLAANPGAGGIAATGAGLGMGMAAGGVFGNMANQMFTPMSTTQQPVQQPIQQPSGRFEQKQADSAAPAPAASDPVEVLGKLKKLLDAGLIEQSEYDAKKAEILSNL
jgi:membrane protease subunit (stomatin/prohibitin family)